MDLANAMVEAGLARNYQGEAKQDWCANTIVDDELHDRPFRYRGTVGFEDVYRDGQLECPRGGGTQRTCSRCALGT
jgi:hypothetical protein